MLLNLSIMLKIIPNKMEHKCKIDYLFKILWFILAQKLNTGLI